MNQTYACIMAGGVGSRFWPASREAMPKQFLDITGIGKSLIRQTYERFEKLVGADNVLVVTHSKYVNQVAEHIPEIRRSQIIGEPARKNTAPAAYLGNAVAASLSEDPVVIMAPADHVIEKEDAFLQALCASVNYARQHPNLMTLGIQPSFAHTGYGYIEYEKGESPFVVRKFTEKPNAVKAAGFLKAGNYLWNAGIFIWRASVLERSYQRYASVLCEQFKDLEFSPESGLNQDQLSLIYDKLESISIDYLIMENAKNVRTMPGDFGWSDVGSWLAARDMLAQVPEENVVFPEKAIIRKSKGCYVAGAGGKAVIIEGLEDYLVVDTEDVLLIYPIRNDQEIKEVRQEFIDRFGDQYS